MANSEIELYDYEGVLAPLGGIENLQIMCGADDFVFETLYSHINRVEFRITCNDLNCRIDFDVIDGVWYILTSKAQPSIPFPSSACYSASSFKIRFEEQTKLSLDF
jgi:hypothetical protein